MIDICIKYCDQILTITDTTDYLKEDSTAIVKNKFKFSESMSITIVKQNTLSESKLIAIAIGKEKRQMSVYIPFDGCFTIIHLILPITEWFNNESQVKFYEKNKIIYGDGENIYYKGKQISVECLLQMDLKDTPVQKLERDYVSVTNLRSNFIEQCRLTFKNRINNKDTSCNLGNLWSVINLLEYYTNKKQLKEIQRIIEKCNKNDTRTKRTCNCRV